MRRMLVFLLLSLMIVMASGFAMAESQYVGVKVDEALVIGQTWPVTQDAAINVPYNDDANFVAWIFYDDSNLYLQYDVTTPFPQKNNYSGHGIWQASSMEFALAPSLTVPRTERIKWIMTRNESEGYVIVTREERTIIENGTAVELGIANTDFGYRGQVIFDLSDRFIESFNPANNESVFFAIMVNDSRDGTERTAMMTLGDTQEASTFKLLTFQK